MPYLTSFHFRPCHFCLAAQHSSELFYLKLLRAVACVFSSRHVRRYESLNMMRTGSNLAGALLAVLLLVVASLQPEGAYVDICVRKYVRT